LNTVLVKETGNLYPVRGVAPIGMMERRASVIIVRIGLIPLPEKQKEAMQTLLSMIESAVPCLSGFKFKKMAGADDRIQRIGRGVIPGKNNTTQL